MGICLCNRNSTIQEIFTYHFYNRSAKVYIKNKNLQGKTVSQEKVLINLTEPSIIETSKIETKTDSFSISRCVLPGMDPRGITEKECQDLCSFYNHPNSLLVALFDGHGSYGKSLVHSCNEWMSKNFPSLENQENPVEFLHNLTIGCDEFIKSPESQIDSFYSGTTAVFVYFLNGVIYCGSVGDSRAVLASNNLEANSPAPESQIGGDKVLLSRHKRRNTFSEFPIKPVQLSEDQKPEHPEELQRIMISGGRVEEMADSLGNRIGPFRVWEMNRDTPGLAMSRSIGDGAGRKLGVISTPIINSFELTESEEFVVMASDGVWDVLENEEVVKFVEAYRRRCVRDIRGSMSEEVVEASNCCIAEMVCEEARYRWLSIVEEEDVFIDDISCVVVEFDRGTDCLVSGGLKKGEERKEEIVSKENNTKSKVFPS